jgi:hypothetical protein
LLDDNNGESPESVTRPYRVHEPLFAQQLQQYEEQQQQQQQAQQQQARARTAAVPHKAAAVTAVTAVGRGLRRPASAPAGRCSNSPPKLQQLEQLQQQQQRQLHRQHHTRVASATTAGATGARNKYSVHTQQQQQQQQQHHQEQQRQRKRRNRCPTAAPTAGTCPLATVVQSAGHGSVRALYGRLRTYEGSSRLLQRGLVLRNATAAAASSSSTGETTTTAQAQFESDAPTAGRAGQSPGPCGQLGRCQRSKS